VTKTKPADIRLREASAKFTRALAAVDGTAKAEKTYRKTKKALAMARQAHAETRPTYAGGPSHAIATIKSVAIKSGKGQARS